LDLGHWRNAVLLNKGLGALTRHMATSLAFIKVGPWGILHIFL
jgi:hypothetical protein